jgi:two-component system, cell cycle response regulator
MRQDRHLSLLMMDVDNFKKTNDTYGHVMGDEVLRELANTLKSSTRALDLVARYGGEEFIVLLPGASPEVAMKVAEKIRVSFSGRIFTHEKGIFFSSVSIGITEIAPQEQDLEAIVARADRALYEAKHTGKNKVVIASDSPKVNLIHKMD